MAGPSGATPRLKLPYPVESDSADVPRDIKALADTLDAALSQVGSIVMWPTATLPAGWLLCNGQQVDASTYPLLAALLGQSGGKVTLPNLTDRFPIGAGANAVKATGGVASVALVAGQTPLRAHTHGGTTAIENSSLAHSHGASSFGWQYVVSDRPGVTGWSSQFGAPGQNVASLPSGGNWGNNARTAADGAPAHTHNFGTGNPNVAEANGAAHENRPPFLSVNFIIRAG